MGTAKVKSGSQDGKLKYPYDAMVYIDGTNVIAVNSEGNVIKRGVAGTDDTTVIQAAIGASTSKTIVKNGSYTITATLKIEKNDYTIDFDGSTLTAGTGIGAIQRIVNDGPEHNQSVIMVWKSSRVIVENVIVDCDNREGTCGILAYGQGELTGSYLNTHITIKNCECYNACEYPKTPPTYSTNGYGIFLCGCINSTVDSCYVHDNPVGIYVYGYKYTGGDWNRGNVIKNCICYNNTIKYVKYFGLGIYGYGDPSLKIINCKITGDHRIGVWLGEGMDKDHNYLVDSCTIQDCWNNGIHLAGYARYCRVQNCTVSNCEFVGIAPGPDNIITGCTVYNCGTYGLGNSPDFRYGAGIYGYGYTLYVTNCLFYDTTGATTQKYGIAAVKDGAGSIYASNNVCYCDVPFYMTGGIVDLKDATPETTDTLDNNTVNHFGEHGYTLTLPQYSWLGSTIRTLPVSSTTSDFGSSFIKIQPYTGDIINLDGIIAPTGIKSTIQTDMVLKNISTTPRVYTYEGGYISSSSTSNANGGTIDWAGLNYLKAYDDNFCTATSSTTALTYRIAGKKQISIPSNATIHGIVVASSCVASHAEASNYVVDNEVRLIKSDGTLSSSNMADTATKWPVIQYGSTGKNTTYWGTDTELWGEAWTPADVASSNFGAVVAVDIISDGTEVTAYMDTFMIRVIYTSGKNKWCVESVNGEVTLL